MARKLSVDLELNAQGYTQGINDAKSATAQYTNATKDLKKETEEYLSQFGSLRKQMNTARKEALDLAGKFAMLGEAEKNSEIGQQMAEDLQIAIEKAAELKDIYKDTVDAINAASSDTLGLDAFKESMEVGKDLATAYAGAIAKLTGNEKALKDAVASLAMIQGGFNAVIKTTNMLQRNSATMIALQRAGVLSLAQAEKVSAAATKASTIAVKGLGAAMKAVPYVAVAAGIIALSTAIYKFATKASDAENASKKLKKELHDSSIQAQKDAQADIVKLNLLYNKTQDVTLKIEDRIDAVKELQKQYPTYFSNLTQEEILVGKASSAYKQLVDDIIAVAMAKAYEDKIAEKARENVDLLDKLAEAQDNYNKKVDEAEQNKYNPSNAWDSGSVAEMGIQKAGKAVENLQKQIDENNKSIGKYQKNIYGYSDSIKRLAENGKQAAGNNNSTGGGTRGKTITTPKPKLAEDVLPPVNKIDKQIKEWFKDYDKKIKTEAQKSFNKTKADFNINLNANIDKQQIDNVVNENKRRTEDILNTIANGKEFEDPFDFSFLSDGAYEEASRLKEQLDSTLDEMTEIFNKFGNTEEAQAGIAALCEQYDKLIEKLKDYQKENEKNKTYATIAENAKTAGDYLNQLGSSFTQLGEATDSTGVKAVGIILETLANLALSFSQAMLQASAMGPWAWMAFGIAGVAQLAAMISQIKGMVSGGFAQGGVIPGSSYVGDKLLARVNSGERVLTAKQNENFEKIANSQYQPYRDWVPATLSFKLKGEDIYGSMSNYKNIHRIS